MSLMSPCLREAETRCGNAHANSWHPPKHKNKSRLASSLKNMNSNNSKSHHDIETRRLLNYAVSVLLKHGFKTLTMQPNGSASLRRPNSEWAVNIEVTGSRLFIENVSKGEIALNTPFVVELVRTGLFSLGIENYKCVITSYPFETQNGTSVSSSEITRSGLSETIVT
jgi:hypothetical protein